MKYTPLKIAVGGALLLLASCNSGKQTDSNAQALFDEANAAFEAADYSRATSLLDSLQKAYPGEIALQREGMALRPKVIEKSTLLQISTNDSLSVLAQASAEQLKGKLKWVKNPRLVEGYWVAAAGYNPNFMNTTGIQGRVSEIGEFYIVSSVAASINHTSVALSNGSASVATPAVAYDGESNYRYNGTEVITFSPQQSDTIGNFALQNSGRPLTLTFRGKQNKSQQLSAAQVTALADAYAYSQAILQGRELATERQRLEATLQVARNQIARTTDYPDSTATNN
jgi:hypothetical protein